MFGAFIIRKLLSYQLNVLTINQLEKPTRFYRWFVLLICCLLTGGVWRGGGCNDKMGGEGGREGQTYIQVPLFNVLFFVKCNG